MRHEPLLRASSSIGIRRRILGLIACITQAHDQFVQQAFEREQFIKRERSALHQFDWHAGALTVQGPPGFGQIDLNDALVAGGWVMPNCSSSG